MGRPQFESVTVQAPKVRLKIIKQELTTSLGAGQAESLYFYSSPNTYSQLISATILFPAPVGATIGDHSLLFIYDLPGSGQNIDIMKGVSAHNLTLDFLYSHFNSASKIAIPANPIEQITVLQSIKFDSETPLVLHYRNSTDVPAAGTRVYGLTVLEHEIAQ
jgi:hypothetical protein